MDMSKLESIAPLKDVLKETIADSPISKIDKEKLPDVSVKEIIDDKVKDLPIKEIVKEKLEDIPVKDFAKEKLEKLKNISLLNLTKSKTEQFKTIIIENYNKVKNYVQANPVLGIMALIVAGFACIPLAFSLVTLVLASSITLGVSLVIISVLTLISAIFLFIPLTSTGGLLFVYYSAYVLAAKTYEKSKTELKNKGNTPTHKIISDCFIKSLNEYIYTITNFFNNILTYIKLRFALLSKKSHISMVKNMLEKDEKKNDNINENDKETKSMEAKKEE